MGKSKANGGAVEINEQGINTRTREVAVGIDNTGHHRRALQIGYGRLAGNIWLNV